MGCRPIAPVATRPRPPRPDRGCPRPGRPGPRSSAGRGPHPAAAWPRAARRSPSAPGGRSPPVASRWPRRRPCPRRDRASGALGSPPDPRRSPHRRSRSTSGTPGCGISRGVPDPSRPGPSPPGALVRAVPARRRSPLACPGGSPLSNPDGDAASPRRPTGRGSPRANRSNEHRRPCRLTDRPGGPGPLPVRGHLSMLRAAIGPWPRISFQAIRIGECYDESSNVAHSSGLLGIRPGRRRDPRPGR